jgi:hypothetical protein
VPTPLLDYQFELSDVVFGRDTDIKLDGPDAFDPGVAGIDTQDANFEQEDGRRFGIDRLRGPTWSWQLFTDRETPEQALASLGAFSKVWRADDVRLISGAYLPLRYAVGGRTRRVYGRPRRLSHPPENRILSGLIPITCDFVTADALTYDDELSSSTMSLSPAVSGGFLVPFEMPLSTLRPTRSKENTVVVTGDAASWAVVTFFGPVTAPVLVMDGGWEIGVETVLTAGQSVTVDAHPWARTAIRNDGASVAGRLTRRSRLAEMKLSSGGHTFQYRGVDDSGTSRATVAWRNASHSL